MVRNGLRPSTVPQGVDAQQKSGSAIARTKLEQVEAPQNTGPMNKKTSR